MKKILLLSFVSLMSISSQGIGMNDEDLMWDKNPSESSLNRFKLPSDESYGDTSQDAFNYDFVGEYHPILMTSFPYEQSSNLLDGEQKKKNRSSFTKGNNFYEGATSMRSSENKKPELKQGAQVTFPNEEKIAFGGIMNLQSYGKEGSRGKLATFDTVFQKNFLSQGENTLTANKILKQFPNRNDKVFRENFIENRGKNTTSAEDTVFKKPTAPHRTRNKKDTLSEFQVNTK